MAAVELKHESEIAFSLTTSHGATAQPSVRHAWPLPPHDTESLFFLVGRLAPILAEMSFGSVIPSRKIATTFSPSWTLFLGANRMRAVGFEWGR
jgi:hypothetical protein